MYRTVGYAVEVHNADAVEYQVVDFVLLLSFAQTDFAAALHDSSVHPLPRALYVSSL